jgi:hypothetical protein
MFSFAYFPGVRVLKADVSEPIKGSEMSAFKTQDAGEIPKRKHTTPVILFAFEERSICKSYYIKDNRCLHHSTCHRMGHLVINYDNLARFQLPYLFNNELYPEAK